MSKSDKPAYARTWEEDLRGSWTSKDWFRGWDRSYKGIYNISLIEASLKVMARWYYVPAKLAMFYPGTSPSCFRDCKLEGTMLHVWWTCPRIRTYWKKIFCMMGSLLNIRIAPDPTIALLNHTILNLPKSSQKLAFFILLGAKITLAKAWKRRTVSFQCCKRKVTWIMSQEKIVAKLLDTVEKFNIIWEPWARYCNISLYPGMEMGPGNLPNLQYQ